MHYTADKRFQPKAYVREGTTVFRVMRVETVTERPLAIRVWLEDIHGVFNKDTGEYSFHTKGIGATEMKKTILVQESPSPETPAMAPT